MSKTAVQIFGIQGSAATRAAERFFKERGITAHFVNLKVRPMAPGEIGRFIQRFGLRWLLDDSSKQYADAGLKYLKLGDAELLSKIEREPKLLRLPFVRAGNLLSIGEDLDAWLGMLGKP